MKQYGPTVSFVLEGKIQAERFLEACHLVLQATSFGVPFTHCGYGHAFCPAVIVDTVSNNRTAFLQHHRLLPRLGKRSRWIKGSEVQCMLSEWLR
jgi:hypothetical protein